MAAVDESALPVPKLQKAFTCSSGAGGCPADFKFASQDEELSEDRGPAECKNKTTKKNMPTVADIFFKSIITVFGNVIPIINKYF